MEDTTVMIRTVYDRSPSRPEGRPHYHERTTFVGSVAEAVECAVRLSHEYALAQERAEREAAQGGENEPEAEHEGGSEP